MRRTSTTLADGRELIYFDEADDAVRRLDDPRVLAAATTSSELRHDPVLDEWVTIASHRQSRTHLPPVHECPLCPSHGGRRAGRGRCEVVCFTPDDNAAFADLTPLRIRTVIEAWIDAASLSAR